MKTTLLRPKRGEVWKVSFDPTVGSEIKKVRPAVVVSSDGIGKLPLRLIVPITRWREDFESNLWHVRVDPTPTNGLSKVSAVDVLQMRSVDVRRFLVRVGAMPGTVLDEIAAAIAGLVEFV